MERFVVPSQVLWSRPEDAVLIVRLGALANAITAVASMGASSLAIGVGDQRDALQALLLMVSYFKEAADAVNDSRTWPLAKAGVAAGYRLPKPIEHFQQLFSRGKGSLYERIKDVRDTKGFHVDVGHFQEWITQLESPEVTLWRKDSGSPVDWIFSASAQIQSFLGAQLDEQTLLRLRDAPLLVFLVEAIACGLLVEVGLNPRASYQPTERRQVRIEYRFRDRRLPLSQMTEAVIDQSGSPLGAISELRDQVTRTIGGRRVSALIPGADCEVAFSNDRGSARAWFGAVISRPTTVPDHRMAVVRMSDMANWGEVWTKRAIEYVHAARSSSASAEMTAMLLADLERDLSYWRERKEEAEAMARRLLERSDALQLHRSML